MTDETLLKMAKAALEIGPVEWGATKALTAEEHAEHVKSSIKLTEEGFGQEGPQEMHGLYIGDSDTVLCHTGTSPNSPTHARILTALWNRFVQEAEQIVSEEQTP